MLGYESVEKCFPGYKNRVAGQSASWLVMSLPYIERSDLWQDWKQGKKTSAYIKMLMCPANLPETIAKGDAPLSYVVNCGRGSGAERLCDGVFFNHDVDGKPLCASLKYIADHDGTSTTLMLSENLQAGWWTDTEKADLGMVWWDSPGDCNNINHCQGAGRRLHDIQYARPSSNHKGGVNCAFCDGHTQFLSDRIDYRVYQQLMAPDDKAAGLPGELPKDNQLAHKNPRKEPLPCDWSSRIGCRSETTFIP
jgi:prepilin-type processing-associated H-X9-DG protein